MQVLVSQYRQIQVNTKHIQANKHYYKYKKVKYTILIDIFEHTNTTIVTKQSNMDYNLTYLIIPALL